MQKIVLPMLITISILLGENQYFQQEVAYDISVTLDDSAHTLSAFETLVYTNHSPDTLDYIWFHLWPNAYKNNETAFAKQRIKNYSTKFHYSNDKKRGFIDSLDFQTDGIPLKWEFHPEWIDVAKVYLSSALLPEGSVTIETPFFVKLPEVFSRLGHTGKHYEITQWYPKPAVYDSDGWHPMPYLNMGEFYSEFGTFDVKITLPQEYRIMATGDLVNGDDEIAWLDSLAREGDALHELDKKAFKKKIKELKKGRKKSGKLSIRSLFRKDKEKKEGEKKDTIFKTLHFRQENVHDFAWFADKKWIVRKGELWLADSTKNVILWSMYFPKNAELWEKSIEYIHDAGYWYSEFFGDYPYNHITAVDGDMSAGGGMEYPNITVISSGGSKDLLEFVIMHEVGHNWFYGILGSNERDHAWLDEGLNTYATFRYWEKKYPERNGQLIIQDFIQNKLKIAHHLNFQWIIGYLGYQSRARTGDDQPIDIPSQDFVRSNYGSIIYGKTGIYTRFLQNYLGEEKMDEVMQEFYETWKFRHPSPGDFKAAFTKHVDQDLSWYFDDVINDTKVVDYAVGTMEENTVIIENLGTMSPPVELAFYDNEKEEIDRIWIDGFEGEKKVSLPGGTERVVIDPDNYMPDISRINNASSKGIKLHFVFDQPVFYEHEINILPWFKWSAYNGFSPGLSLYSGFVPGYPFGISVLPVWDFEHQRLTGSMSAQRSFYQKLGFRSLTIKSNIARYEGRTGGMIQFTGLLRKPVISTPSTTLSANIFYHDIESSAVDSFYYTPGTFTIVRLSGKYAFKVSPFLNYSAGVNAITGNHNAIFSVLSLSGRVSWKYQKNLTVKARAWIGSVVSGETIPNQYKIWMSGGVDADFESSYVFNRTDNNGKHNNSTYDIYDEQFIRTGPALRGAVFVASEETAWGLNIDHSLPYVPVGLFLDIAGATDLGQTYFDAGIKMKLGFITFYLPMYQSWEDKENMITGFAWLKSRARFEFSLPNIRIGG
ncbi:MAG: M1 family metallopeptidase [Candidatus Marinimicrobia bacterium]|nr:M1 family metallopeptidase [Candidatus Neomarinimicrobiota bacterium]